MKAFKKISMLFGLVGVVTFANISTAQSLRDQFSAEQNKQIMKKKMEEDRELIKKEQLKKAGITPEDLKSRGQILVCKLPREAFSGFDGVTNEMDINMFLGTYILIDGNIVRYRPGNIDAGPAVRGRLSQAGNLLKTGKVGNEDIKWEHDLSSGETFIGVGARVYKARCGLSQFNG